MAQEKLSIEVGVSVSQYFAEINMIISVGMATEEGIWGPRFRVPFDEVVFRK